MPHRIRIEPSSEVIMLDQIMTSVSDRLDGLAEQDPAAPPLREHLAELTARRDLLARAQEDSSYEFNRRGLWVWLLCDVMGIAALALVLADLAGRSRIALSGDVAALVAGVVLLLFGAPFTFMTCLDMRDHRRTRAAERS